MWIEPKPGLRKTVDSALAMLLPRPSQLLLAKDQQTNEWHVLPWNVRIGVYLKVALWLPPHCQYALSWNLWDYLMKEK